jgi:molybdenum cofactor biosynthesis enzyme MoaA
MNDISIRLNGTPRKRFCANNHDISIVGRDTGSGKECSECRRIRVNKSRRKWYDLQQNDPIKKMKDLTRKRIKYMEENYGIRL